MTRYAHQVLRAMHAASLLAIGVAIAAVMLGAPHIAIAAVIPVLFVNILSLEALRVGQAKLESR